MPAGPTYWSMKQSSTAHWGNIIGRFISTIKGIKVTFNMKKEIAPGKTSEEEFFSALELDGPFLIVFFPNMKTWTVMTITIKENVFESNWLTLRDESQQTDKFSIKFC